MRLADKVWLLNIPEAELLSRRLAQIAERTQSLGAFWNFDHCAQWRQGS